MTHPDTGPGPSPATATDSADGDPTLDRLAGEWWIYQRQHTQRYSTDDILVAHSALEARPQAAQVLDMGAGVGSVGLLTLLGLPASSRLTAVEILADSAGLMRRTIEHNDLGSRARVVCGDLREPQVLDARARFDLVVANPPYLPERAATASPHAARAAARLELHGDVLAYCQAANRWLAPGGAFCFCHAADDKRPEQAILSAGLHLLSRRDVVFREGRRPTIALFTCAAEGETVPTRPLLIRRRDGARSDAFCQIRRRLLMDA
ncbi:MAG: methyltransferase [Pseudomonadota bacterium]